MTKNGSNNKTNIDTIQNDTGISDKVVRDSNESEVIFFGNGPLADFSKEILTQHTNILFHARTKDDLATVIEIKQSHPQAFGILASFGVMIKPDILELFEPIGILNIHPSKLPAYRGASPIESAILAGDTEFSYSIMKLVKAMDAGPIYHQETISGLPIDKPTIYQTLATHGAKWLSDNLKRINSITPSPQDDSAATFTTKLDKSMSDLHPESHTANEIFRQIVAYQNFPKPKFEFFGKKCIILKAHVVSSTSIICDPSIMSSVTSPLMIKCQDRNFVAVDELQPEGKKPMSAQAFMNGYGKAR